ncbi:YjaG family protein [Terriglobus albidus]|uniref:YjaG family protein n=1 Tax=Terriglobus albidus TaxID=1592106 RepID=UPI0021DFF462|nr:YjaG family protein [Terriglobus albidus]
MIGNDKLLVSVGRLSRKKQLAFALLIFERMLPSLFAFSKDTGFNASCYVQAKDAAWATLQNSTVHRSISEACLRGVPDTEDYSHELTSFALNAALAANDIISFTKDGRAEHITSVSALAGDSLYLYLSDLEGSGVSSTEEDSWIVSHALMREENRRQEADIEFLAGLPEPLSDEAIISLKVRAGTQPPLLPLTM